MSTPLERAAQYRAEAVEVLRLVERRKNDRRRMTLLNLAAVYQRLAEQIEEMHRLRDKPTD